MRTDHLAEQFSGNPTGPVQTSAPPSPHAGFVVLAETEPSKTAIFFSPNAVLDLELLRRQGLHLTGIHHAEFSQQASRIVGQLFQRFRLTLGAPVLPRYLNSGTQSAPGFVFYDVALDQAKAALSEIDTASGKVMRAGDSKVGDLVLCKADRPATGEIVTLRYTNGRAEAFVRFSAPGLKLSGITYAHAWCPLPDLQLLTTSPAKVPA